MAPHGFCFLWLPEIVWLHVVADALIAVSYFSIPLALWYFAQKRPDVPFHRVFILFATFITLCGLTHVVDIIVLWKPYYGIQGLLMLLTGIVSSATALFVWRILPRALTLPSPSDLLQANRKLAESYAAVEQKVAERTRELEDKNAALMEASIKADDANRAKTEFLANMSHEIRTPMNVVMGLAEILAASRPLTPKQEKYIGTLRSSADSMLTLINDLLNIEKIESKTLEFNNAPFSVRASVDQVFALMALQAKEKGLVFRTENKCRCIEKRIFLGDADRFRQILLNLVSNAIKFTEAGSVTVTILCEETADHTVENVLISVADTGIGIPADKIQQVFEKFTQVDASISRKYGGTGLGLAIAKNLAERMGGTIAVSSQAGQGSVFTVSIPLKISQPDLKNESGAPARLLSGDNPVEKAGKLHILLAEDYEPNMLVATTLLAEFGYSYEMARNGREAIEKFRSGNFDLILMDVQMPEMDGLQATAAIREIERKDGRARTPVVGTTAHALKEDRARCLDAGMDDYLAKPYYAEALLEKIKSAVGQ